MGFVSLPTNFSVTYPRDQNRARSRGPTLSGWRNFQSCHLAASRFETSFFLPNLRDRKVGKGMLFVSLLMIGVAALFVMALIEPRAYR